MQYLQFMFQDLGHFAGCFLMLLTAAVLLIVFIENMTDRFTRLVYVWRFPAEVDEQDTIPNAPLAPVAPKQDAKATV